jgi:hypothetical protein
VHYATTALNATSSDYTDVQGNLTIPANTMSASFQIPILAQRSAYQGDRTFEVDLSLPQNAEIANDSAIGTIHDEQFSILNQALDSSIVTVNESAGTVTLLVKPSSASWEAPISVSYADREFSAHQTDDYGAVAGTLTWQPGDATPQSITIPIVDDSDAEDTEHFYVDLSNPIFSVIASPNYAFLNQAAAFATVNINDNDPDPTISIDSSVSVDEGELAQLHVRLSRASQKTITVDVSTINGTAVAGTDYQGQSQSITFNPGDVDKVFAVLTKDDLQSLGNKAFNINLDDIVNAIAGQTTGTVTIIDNQSPTAVDDSYTTGLNTPVNGNVLSNDTDPENDPLTVAVATQPANGSVTLYANGPFTYTPNTNFGGPDSFTYTVTDSHGNTSTATVTITVGTYTNGYTHAEGSWVDGFVHDNGTWVDGWNVYGYDENSNLAFLFFSDATNPDPNWDYYEAAQEWAPDPNGGTTWTAGALDPSWVNPVAQQQFVGTGNRIWTAAASPDPTWVDIVNESRWV